MQRSSGLTNFLVPSRKRRTASTAVSVLDEAGDATGGGWPFKRSPSEGPLEWPAAAD